MAPENISLRCQRPGLPPIELLRAVELPRWYHICHQRGAIEKRFTFRCFRPKSYRALNMKMACHSLGDGKPRCIQPFHKRSVGSHHSVTRKRKKNPTGVTDLVIYWKKEASFLMSADPREGYKGVEIKRSIFRWGWRGKKLGMLTKDLASDLKHF